LQKVRDVLASKPGTILIQGHSDDIPINTQRYRSNWELSAARAVSVAHELMKEQKIPSNRFEISGKAETLPLAPNNTNENRARNRRVEIIIQQGLNDELTPADKAVLQTQEGQDILRELEIEPKYLFDLKRNEVF
jgi:chemotaxis protein MotB